MLCQAIAALNKALGADPTSLEVLLSLGVSHTNELDAGEPLPLRKGAGHYLCYSQCNTRVSVQSLCAELRARNAWWRTESRIFP
jgi:hypothetical protein